MMTAPTEATESQGLLLQLLDPANRADPYRLCAQFRDRGPLQLPDANLAVFLSYRDCDEVLRHPSSSSENANSTVARRQAEAGTAPPRQGPPGFLFLDPPDHTRLRKLVSKAFAPRVVSALQPDIRSLVDGLLDRVAEKGQFEVVEDFAYPLPVAVICRLLGVPLEDEPQFSRASALLAQALDPFSTITGVPAEVANERQQAGTWLRDYFHGLIDKRRSRPGEDLLSGLIAVEESGDQLTEEEIVSTCNLLLIAGHETTVNLIGNAVLAMLRNPGQWAALGADADRAPAIVEETLRYDPPVQLAGRIALADMVIGGVEVPAGDVMMLLLAGANRDPAEYDRPDVFDPERKNLRHLGFGRGAHYCLGAPLARLEASVALAAVAARFPNARLDGEPQYKTNVTLRGLSQLTLAI
ncbi:cytochrome P450 [Mycobacterium intracellulare]|uniref:Cytochrome P450 n=1 Tax=Mycobacterium intracellulare subsp. chimaera TaxID=222805 RepID=A0A220Y5C1_MYCIT|nr:cytochrome P450 [Mycobacterium intracellulare]APD83849.1 cytochrome [Mycobacterium intracellulare subsp. chimaera]ARV80280.1 cytochrome P450 [Mycobacterium intracellulare subsp. chimaera]ASL07113.1 cytochrome P450 [Mycobacterium intracellulare subsp. chimaera]ASL12795.1 cytochrome P450 [Mycobacterium intracellulare subsp. chimaera]ASL18951.1 cytochrome P450 [Mycobacterium intracellulare subsp. chimaera]